jgi:formate dehydrogenase subunit gamma
VNAPRALVGTARLLRFTWAERMVHRTTAVLMLVCIVTAAILYNGNLSIRFGHRHLIELVHVYCGLALPVPMLLGLLSRAYRADLSRLDRFTRSDWRWLRRRTRRDAASAVGKFNAGQKVNAWLSCGAILVLLSTGVIMFFVDLAPLAWRTGATFVHDWFALGVGLLVLGHIYRASRDAEARRGMRRGTVDAQWAAAEHPAWAADHPAGSARAEPAHGADTADEQ